MKTKTRGAVQMILAMTISGTVGWPVLVLGQPPATVVFWRCAFGALAMLATCAALGQLKQGAINRRQLAFAILGGIALVLIGRCCLPPISMLRSLSLPSPTTFSRSCWWRWGRCCSAKTDG